MLESSPNFSSDPELLQTVLQPLLEDFLYWFGRSQGLLETHELDFLGTQQQADLLKRVKQARQEVSSAQALFKATGSQVGIDPSVLLPWHRLVTECWQVGARFRRESSHL